MIRIEGGPQLLPVRKSLLTQQDLDSDSLPNRDGDVSDQPVCRESRNSHMKARVEVVVRSGIGGIAHFRNKSREKFKTLLTIGSPRGGGRPRGSPLELDPGMGHLVERNGSERDVQLEHPAESDPLPRGYPSPTAGPRLRRDNALSLQDFDRLSDSGTARPELDRQLALVGKPLPRPDRAREDLAGQVIQNRIEAAERIFHGPIMPEVTH